MPRRRRPPVRQGGFSQLPSNTPVKPTPYSADGFTQQPATGVRQPPVTVIPERPIVDPTTGDPYVHQQTAGAYVAPHVAEQAALDAGHTAKQVHQAAISYATQRLSALARVAHVAGDTQLNLILQSNGDPLQVYAAASKRWAELAKRDGYADPRMWLRDMIARSQAARPTNAQPV